MSVEGSDVTFYWKNQTSPEGMPEEKKRYRNVTSLREGTQGSREVIVIVQEFGAETTIFKDEIRKFIKHGDDMNHETGCSFMTFKEEQEFWDNLNNG